MSAIIDLLVEHGLGLNTNRWWCPVCDSAQAKSKSVRFFDYKYKCYRCNTTGTIQTALSTFLGKTDLPTGGSAEGFKAHTAVCNVIAQVYQRQFAQAHEYLIARGYPADQVTSWSELGYAPSNDYLRAQGITWAQLKGVGLDGARAKELYKERVVFPIRSTHGQITHFQARSVNADSTCKWLAAKVVAGFKPLSAVLWGADQLKRYQAEYGYVFLCEGLSDAYAIRALGFPVVATFGIQNLRLLGYLELFKGLKIIACYDNDRYAVGTANAGLYKSWHYVLPQLSQLLSDADLGIELYTFDPPIRSGIKDMFDLALALDWSSTDFEALVLQQARRLEQKALEVYSADDYLYELIKCFKPISQLSVASQAVLEQRVQVAGGWLEVLRRFD